MIKILSQSWSAALLGRIYRLLWLVVALASLPYGKAWAIDTGPVGSVVVNPGSYIVDLGQATQSYANGLKPYGLVYDLIVTRKVPVDWVINPTKLFGGSDFTLGAKTYSGGAFVIRAEFVTPAAITAINSFKALGVVVDGPTTAAATTVPVYNTLTSWPNSVLDTARGSIAAAFYTNASVPATSYRFALPTGLTACDDFFALPHADPTWVTHGAPIKTFVVNQGGYFWAGCHAVSVFENLVNPGNATDKTNFLSTNGLVPYTVHADGTPPYSYKTSGGNEPPMQFIGNLDAASQNGSEQIYLPAKPGGWRSTSSVLVWDPTQADVPSKSLGEAAQLVYGRSLGLASAGRTMYEGGHDIDTGNNPAAVAAQRAYFDFLLLAGIDRRPEISYSIPSTIPSAASVSLSASITGGTPIYSFAWSSSCGGSFSSTTLSTTTFTAPAVVANTACVVRVEVRDACNRVNFLSNFTTIAAPAVTPRIDITKRVSGAVIQISPKEFEVPYILDIKNAGTVLAANIQVVDDLAAAFPGATLTVKSGTMNLGALTAPIPAAFNGTSQKNLLDGGDNLAIGALASINFTVVVNYGANLIPTAEQNNSATATTAATKGGAPLSTDTSTNNIDNGVTQPSAADASAPTPVIFLPQKLDVVKSAGTPIQTSPNIFEIPYVIKLKNTSTVSVTNVQVVDSLAATFNTGVPLPGITIKIGSFATIAQGGAVAPQCAGPATAYNGTTSIALLKGDQTLQVGQECDVTFTVVLAYGGSIPSTTQNNSAYASSATSANAGGIVDSASGAFTPPVGVLARDDSTNSPTLPATANGDTALPTPVSFSPQALDVVKSAGAPVQTAPATFEVPYTLVVKNTSNVVDANVQVVDSLSATYSAGSPVITIKAASYSANAPTSAAACAAPTSAFDGVTNIALLKGDFNLAAGEQCSIKFTAVITYPSLTAVPTAAQNNTAYASTNIGASTGGTINPATGLFTPPAGGIAQDASTSANIPPASSNGDVAVPTSVTFAPQKLDVVKNAGAPVQSGVTTFDIPYTIQVKNTGTVAATNVNAVDNLSLTFASGTPVITLPAAPVITASGGATAAQCAASASAFNGTTNLALLKGDQTLQPGQECDITFTVHLVYPSAAAIPSSPQNNSVIATSASTPNNGGSYTGSLFNAPAGNLATDISTNGPALPGTANGDTSSPTPISLVPQNIDAVKQAAPYAQTGPSSFEVPYTVVVKNTGAVAATNVQAVDSLNATYSAGSPTLGIKAGSYSVTGVAACTAPVTAYDGTTNIALLSGSGNLAAGEQCTISFTAVVSYASVAAIPSGAQNNSVYASTATGANSGGSVNPATGVFTPPAGVVAQDTSTSGTIPPALPNGDTPIATPVTFATQKIDTVKSAAAPINLGSPAITLPQVGFDVPYTIKVKNTGTVPATNVNVADNLANTFASGAPVITIAVPAVATPQGGASAAQCALATAAFNGTTNVALLKGDQTLQPGQECDITFTARVIYTNAAAVPQVQQANTAIASTATAPNNGGSFTGSAFNSPAGILSSDISTDSNVTPGAANGDVPIPTPVSFSPQKIDVVKSLVGQRQVSSTGFEADFVIKVKNSVAAPATNVQVVDKLTNAFSSGSPLLTVKNHVTTALGGATAAQCAGPTATFDGNNNIALLKGDQTLNNGQECDIAFTVVVAYPNAAAIPVVAQNNQANATTSVGPNSGGTFTGTAFNSPLGTVAQDISTVGNTLPAPANSDTPSPTPISFAQQKIDTTKSAVPIAQLSATSFETTFSIKVRNLAAEPATNVNVVDSLATWFSTGTPNIVVNNFAIVAAGTTGAAKCAGPTTAFDGNTAIALLAGNQTMLQNEGCDISFKVTLTYPNTTSIPNGALNNSAVATTTPVGQLNSGGSYSGTTYTPATNTLAQDSSTDGNTTPATANADTAKPTPVSLVPAKIDVVKAVGVPKQTGPKTFQIAYTVVIGNIGATSPTIFGVQANDSLAATFAGATTAVSGYATNANVPTPAASCLGNAAFNGVADTKLISGTTDLKGGEACTISFTANIDYGANPVPATPNLNTVYASGVPAGTSGSNSGYIISVPPGGGAPTVTPPTNAVTTDVSVNGAAPAAGSLPGTAAVVPLLPVTPGADAAAGVATPVLLTPAKLDVLKSAGVPLQVAAKIFEVPYAIVVGNVGATSPIIYNAKAQDNLDRAFPNAAITIKSGSYSVTPSTGAVCTVAVPPFNGTTNYDLLAGTDDLAGDQSCIIKFIAVVDYGSNPVDTTPRNNTAYASGMGDNASANPGYVISNDPAVIPTAPASAVATDISVTGPAPTGAAPGTPPADPTLPATPNGDSQAGVPTSVVLTAAKLDVVKSAGAPINTAANVFEVPYAVVVGNVSTSSPTAYNVQANDSLAAAYPSAVSIKVKIGSYAVTPNAAATCTPNSAFDGVVNTKLLAGTDSLSGGQSCTIIFTTEATFAAGQVPAVAQNNSAYASATPSGTGANTGFAIVQPAGGGAPSIVPPGNAVTTDISNAGPSLPATSAPGTPAVVPGLPTTPNADSALGVPTPVVLKVNPGKISGSVWEDNGTGNATGNNVKDAGESGIVGWTVEVIDPITRLPILGTDGQPVRAVTGADGSYNIANVPPGKWSLQFRAPGSTTAPGAVYGTPVNGELPNTGSAQSTPNSSTRSLDIDVAPGATIPQQSLPLDPSGVVYDSATRAPIAGATVTLIGPDGQPVPASLLLPNQQNQLTLASGSSAGAYRFDLLPSAPAGTYTIKITPPAGYTAVSAVLPPEAGAFTPPSLPGPQVSLGTAKAPQVGETSSYYLTFNFTPGTSRDVIHNNIPLDPTDGGTLFIRKEVNRTNVEIGDALTYRITVRSTKLAGPVQVVDRLPLGFKLIPNTTKIGSSATALEASSDPAGVPGPQLTFKVTLPVNQDVMIEYKVRVGMGADRGDGINRAQAQLGALRSLEAQAKVKVSGGVFSRDACVVGKVYADCNQNKQQDLGEPGIPGVRLYMEDGTNITTDENGQYSICGLRPITHVLKVDSTTMPIGSRLGITSSRNAGDADSLFIDLKAHELYRADFIEQSCFPKVLDQIEQRRKLGPVNVPQIHDEGKDEKWTIQFDSEKHILDRTPAVIEGGRQ